MEFEMIGKAFGDYQIIGALGKGGFGNVWLSESSDGLKVALKVLSQESAQKEKFINKFFQEAIILAKLNHPHITQLFNIFRYEKTYAIAMELVEGTTLRKMLQSEEPLSFDQGYEIALQSMDALHYAHENGILHRDIKPENIMVNTEGICKIMDFGIAQISTAVQHDTAHGMLSYSYAPPERFRKGTEIDVRSDIYSMGIVLYEMFAGRKPFIVEDTAQMMYCHLNEIPDPPSKYSEDMPPTICDAISKALEKNPEDRFDNFRAFAEAIQTVEPFEKAEDGPIVLSITKGDKIGRYELVREIHTGEYGSVWKARSGNQMICVLKVLGISESLSETELENLFNEAARLKELNHPNIGKIYEVLRDGNRLAFVMEYIQGVDFKKFLASQTVLLPFDRSFQIAKQMLGAFRYAHEKGFLHGEIIPANIMIEKLGGCRILSFRTAHIISKLTAGSSAKRISLHYAAPECYEPDIEVDVRSDIYSLGLVFYEMFSGVRAFRGDNPELLMFSHLNTLPEDPSEYNEDIPLEISRAILKALEKNPDDRFRDFREFNAAMTMPEPAKKVDRIESMGPAEGGKIGNYKIIGTIGESDTLKARSDKGEAVALKVSNPRAAENEKVVRRFFHEASLLSKLDHPNICKLIDFFPDNENYCIAMEFIDGTDLKTLLEREPVPLNLGLKIAAQVLDGFQYASENGFLHRYIRPSAIMIDKAGQAKILGFGKDKLVFATEEDTEKTMRDFYYFSPERYDPGKAVNVRSDIYSLGLVFYEMFAGRRPFDAVETSRVMFCHLNEIPEPISIYAKKIPSDVSTAISRALEKDPDHRFNDFREFKQALGLASLIDSEGTVPDDDDDMTLALGRPQDEDENKRELFERDSARPSTRHTYGHAAVGDKLGDYEILSSLGKGGFGNVWKARSWDDKPVAVKVLNPQVLENEKVVRKFFHEASILSMLDHPNICRFIEFFPDGNNYCLAMEFIEGDELKKIIQQQEDPIPIDQAYEIAMQTLDVFQYMYEHGILYRDICPANIMIDRDGIPKIFDFSIGKLPQTVSHDTASSMLRIHYCPPERFDPKRVVDVRSDIYSLGLVFYEMFTGRRPFNATETSQIMFCHLNEIPEPPSSWGGGLSPDIDKAILKALEKDPDDRFNDFMEFKKAIDPTGTYLPKTPRAIGPADAAPVLYVKNTTLMTSGEANDIDEEFIRSFADRITAQARSTGLPIGERIGDYEIVRNLGSGGFARVWQAHSSEGKTVAIKALNPQVLENEKVVRKFFHEASILSMLDHPNICRFIEFFPDGYRYCLAMEYIDGVSLKEVVKEYAKPLPMEFAYRIAGQLLGAFQYAYEKRVLHRDINPTNILIDKNRDAKITDFIIGKLPRTASHDTAASMLTVHYVPPERFDPSKEVDVRSDIYSLGLVFYEMFAGRRPFNATETSQIMFCHLNEIPDPPSVYANEIPPDVSDAISRALEKYPDDRFNNFDEFAEAMGFSRADPENENGTDNKNTPFSSDPISPADAKPKTKYREKLMERIRRLRSK